MKFYTLIITDSYQDCNHLGKIFRLNHHYLSDNIIEVGNNVAEQEDTYRRFGNMLIEEADKLRELSNFRIKKVLEKRMIEIEKEFEIV